MKKYCIDLEIIDTYIFTERELDEKIVYKLCGQCFGLRKNMGRCREIKVEEENETWNLGDITIINNFGEFNIFKGDELIINTAFLE